MEEDLLSDMIWLIVFQERKMDVHWTAPRDMIKYLIGVCVIPSDIESKTDPRMCIALKKIRV